MNRASHRTVSKARRYSSSLYHQSNLGKEHRIKSGLCLSLVSCSDQIRRALGSLLITTPRQQFPGVCLVSRGSRPPAKKKQITGEDGSACVMAISEQGVEPSTGGAIRCGESGLGRTGRRREIACQHPSPLRNVSDTPTPAASARGRLPPAGPPPPPRTAILATGRFCGSMYGEDTAHGRVSKDARRRTIGIRRPRGLPGSEFQILPIYK
jgi:hypothetical protein